jgi:hypothetical protein
MQKRTLKVTKKSSPTKSSKLQRYLILTTIIPAIILIPSCLGVLSGDWNPEIWGGIGIWVGYGLVFIVILAEIRHATGSKRFNWRYYVLPLIIPILVAGAISVDNAIKSHNEQVLEQTPGYKLAMAYSDQCDAIISFTDTIVSDDTRLNIVTKTGIDTDALKQRIFDIKDFSNKGDCFSVNMSEAAAKRIEDVYLKIQPLNTDMRNFDTAYQAALVATYGDDPSVYPDISDPIVGFYSWFL